MAVLGIIEIGEASSHLPLQTWHGHARLGRDAAALWGRAVLIAKLFCGILGRDPLFIFYVGGHVEVGCEFCVREIGCG